MTRLAASFMSMSAFLSFGFSKRCASENAWKPLPSILITRKVLGSNESGCSKDRTYSKRDLAIRLVLHEEATLLESDRPDPKKFRGRTFGELVVSDGPVQHVQPSTPVPAFCSCYPAMVAQNGSERTDVDLLRSAFAHTLSPNSGLEPSQNIATTTSLVDLLTASGASSQLLLIVWLICRLQLMTRPDTMTIRTTTKTTARPTWRARSARPRPLLPQKKGV